jgi:hypothetical protein
MFSTYFSTDTAPTADVSGTFEGSLARDTISVGGLSITNQDLAVMPSSSLSSASPFSGIIGLAFPSISRFGKPTFLQNLVSAGRLKNGLFSFYFSRNGTSGSELTLGGADDKKHHGGFLRVPVVSETHVRFPFFLFISFARSDLPLFLQWTIQTSEVLVDRKRTKKVAVATAIDTGSSVVRLLLFTFLTSRAHSFPFSQSYMPKAAVASRLLSLIPFLAVNPELTFLPIQSSPPSPAHFP